VAVSAGNKGFALDPEGTATFHFIRPVQNGTGDAEQ
jgi:hypothetical protein